MREALTATIFASSRRFKGFGGANKAHSKTDTFSEKTLTALVDVSRKTQKLISCFNASILPIVVAFECNNTSKADQLKCLICLETRHAETNEIVRLAKCCQCPVHLSCVYKWLAAQYDIYKPHEQWGCPHCRAPVKDLADNPDPCVICGSKETDQLYHEPVAQAVPCCDASAHQQCLYNYIKDNFREDCFPCPACQTMLGAQRSMTMSIRAPGDPPPPTSFSGVLTERLNETPPRHPMITRSRGRGQRRNQTARLPHSDGYFATH